MKCIARISCCSSVCVCHFYRYLLPGENIDTVPALISRQVRDHDRGEAWYFNPLTGKSQWDRPGSLLGTITPSEKVREETGKTKGKSTRITRHRRSPQRRPQPFSTRRSREKPCVQCMRTGRPPYGSGAACYQICQGTRTDRTMQTFGVFVPTDVHPTTDSTEVLQQPWPNF